jgi:hypothetical protein
VPAPLSYEPTVNALLHAVLPAASRVLVGGDRLRRRVSWPVLARVTGLGEIEGGEVVLVPSARVGDVLPRLRELADVGVAAIVLADDDATDRIPRNAESPAVVAVPAATDLRRIQGEIERYITRRRRDLHSLDQELHPILIDAAIGGADVLQLLDAASRRVGRQLVLDRDGDILSLPSDAPTLPNTVLVEARIACHESNDAGVEISGPPACLALPVTAGKERRGIAIIVGNERPIADEDEVLLTVLSSACAIALAREPAIQLDPLENVVESMAVPTSARVSAQNEWAACVLADDSAAPAQLQRAVRAELASRDLRFILASYQDTLAALLPAASSSQWTAMARSIGSRLGTNGIRAAVGRAYPGPSGVIRSAQEAVDALAHLSSPGVLFFADIELAVLLLGTPRWEDFARARLGPLLDGRQDGIELLQTLRAYLHAGRNAKSAAHRLQVHRNTLLYRLRRIEERLSVSLSDPDTLFALDLATRIIALREERASVADDSD